MSDRDEHYRQAMRALAGSVADEPPLSGAEVRSLAERSRRRRRLAVPTTVACGLLLGGTAFALGGAFRTGLHPGRHPAPTASAPAIPTASPSSPPKHSGSAKDPASGGPSTPSGAGTDSARPAAAAPSAPADPSATASCPVARPGETLESLHALTTQDGLSSVTAAPDVGTVVFAVPVSCVHGHVVPGGTGRWLPVAPEATVTTTAPLSAGSTGSPSTLRLLAAGLARHPDELFGIHRNDAGQVVRMDEVYQG